MRVFLVVLAIFSLLTGLGCGFVGILDNSNMKDLLVADRWHFFVQEEGVADRQQAYRIAERLAKDVPQSPNNRMLITAGILLVLNAGVLLAGAARSQKSTP